MFAKVVTLAVAQEILNGVKTENQTLYNPIKGMQNTCLKSKYQNQIISNLKNMRQMLIQRWLLVDEN